MRPMLRSTSAAALALAGLAATTSLALPARAAQSKTITGTVSLSGDVPYDQLTIKAGGRIQVLGPAGSLHIHANRIVIEKGGVIDASGDGYAGQNGADGLASP